LMRSVTSFHTSAHGNPVHYLRPLLAEKKRCPLRSFKWARGRPWTQKISCILQNGVLDTLVEKKHEKTIESSSWGGRSGKKSPW
jgi:hypothetical protein